MVYKRVELGYWLSEEYWGKGIVPEAAKLIIKYFFSDDFTYQVNGGQPVLRVEANIYAWNRASGMKESIITRMEPNFVLNRKSLRKVRI